jgi:hypothetical protein
METRLAQVIDQLVALTRALPNHRGPDDQTTADDVSTVYDGPEMRATDDLANGGHLVIGWSGDSPDEVVAAGSSTITRGPMAATVHPANEIGTVNCRAIFQRGETPKLARDGALAEITAVAQLCRATPDLGINTSGTIGGVRTVASVTIGEMYQYLDRGNVCLWDFSVTFETRV